MTKADAKKFAEIMAYLGVIFGKELTPTVMKMLFKTLADLSIEQVEQAAFHIANNRKITGTFPLPAEFREAVENRDGSVTDKAELAWLALVWAIEHVGHWRSVSFDDPAIHDVVAALGGWLKIQNADNPEWNSEAQMQWRRKEFIGLYRIMAKQAHAVAYLVGEQEAGNAGRYDDFVPRVVHIGGKPGQYITTETERPKQLPGPESKTILPRQNLDAMAKTIADGMDLPS